jgi:ArsR family transcriptional regulator, virulence genes transcriptional regulator
LVYIGLLNNNRGRIAGMPVNDKYVKKQSTTDYLTENMRLHATDAADLMKALGNENRLMILCALAEGERSVGDMNDVIPLSQSALSQQLAKLRRQGLVDTRRDSQTIYYSLADGPADRVIHLLHNIYCGSDASE